MLISLLVACTEELPPDQSETLSLVRPYVDRSRETPEAGELQASPERVLDTWVWIGPSPGEDAPERPLLLLLHGLDGHPDKFEVFARALAEAGVVVAAPVFPVSNRDSGAGALSITDLSEQVRDVSFVLDSLLADREDESSPLWARFHPERLVGFGHSMGGATLLGATRYGSGEPRLIGQGYFAAAMQLQLALGPTVAPGGPVTLVACGTEDDAVPQAFADDLFEAIEEPKSYLCLLGAGHSDPIEGDETPPLPLEQALIDATIALVDAATRDQIAPLDEALTALAGDGHEVR